MRWALPSEAAVWVALLLEVKKPSAGPVGNDQSDHMQRESADPRTAVDDKNRMGKDGVSEATRMALFGQAILYTDVCSSLYVLIFRMCLRIVT